MAHFEIVSKYKDSNIDLIPKRATQFSAGYDMVAAEDVIVQPWLQLFSKLEQARIQQLEEIYVARGGNPVDAKVTALNDANVTPMGLGMVGELTKHAEARPTLISTGVKVYLDEGQYLQLVSRSSSPLKYWLICANSVGRP